MKTDTQTIITLLRRASQWLGKASAENVQEGCVGAEQLDKVMQGCGDMAEALKAGPDPIMALQGLFEHCAMIHKYGGEIDNTKEANAAIAYAHAVLVKAKEGKPRALTVRLSFEEGAEIDPEDVGLEDDYPVEIRSAGDDGQDAGRALDEFARTVAVKCLDYVETEVLDGETVLVEADNYESYSYAEGSAPCQH